VDELRMVNLVGGLYECAAERMKLASLGAMVAREVGSESAIVFTAERSSTRLTQLISTSANFGDKAREDYRAYYHDRNEWFRRGARLAPPIVVCGGELIAYPDFDRTEFCADWCRRVGIYHVLAATFEIEPGVVVAIGVHRERNRPPFSDGDKRVMTVALPHLARAIQIADRLGAHNEEKRVSGDVVEDLGVGILLLDPRLRVLTMNAVAEALLRGGRWLRVSNGRIRAARADCAEPFAKAVSEACRTSAGLGLVSGGSVRLRDDFDRPIRAIVAPFVCADLDLGPGRPAALVVLADPDTSVDAAAASFAATWELTPAESRLVGALLDGRTLVGYARKTGLSPNTAKAQLGRVFEKTGATSQPHLIRMMLADPIARVSVGESGE
jgi:DNA-binding CsgD family transcriptional regulator